jgi:hypothetical protein
VSACGTNSSRASDSGTTTAIDSGTGSDTAVVTNDVAVATSSDSVPTVEQDLGITVLDASVSEAYNPTCDLASCTAAGGTQCITAAAGSICVHPCPGNVCPQLSQTAYCDQFGGTYCQ